LKVPCEGCTDPHFPSFSGVIWFQYFEKSLRTAPRVVMLPANFVMLLPPSIGGALSGAAPASLLPPPPAAPPVQVESDPQPRTVPPALPPLPVAPPFSGRLPPEEIVPPVVVTPPAEVVPPVLVLPPVDVCPPVAESASSSELADEHAAITKNTHSVKPGKERGWFMCVSH
jgi:hypothetical protein